MFVLVCSPTCLVSHTHTHIFPIFFTEEVDVANNNFSGPLIDDLGYLTNMKIFDITNNNFESTVPSLWGNWENIERYQNCDVVGF